MAILQATVEAIWGLQTEIAIFILAVVAHAALFGFYRVKVPALKAKRPQDPRQAAAPMASDGAAPSPQPPATAVLLRSAKQLLRQGANRQRVAEKFEEDLGESHPEIACDALEGMLEGIGRGANAETLAAVRDVARQRSLLPSTRFYELLLKSYLGMRLQGEFKEVLADAESSCVEITPGIAMLVLKASLSTSDLDTACKYLRHLAPELKAGITDAGTTPSAAPQQLMQQLVQLAAQKAAVPALLQELGNCELLTAGTLEAVFTDCAKKGDAASLKQAEGLAREQGVELTGSAYGALVRGTRSSKAALRFFTEAAEQGLMCKGLLLSAAERASAKGDAALAGAVAQHARAAPTPEVAAALVRLSAEGPLAGQDPDAAVLGLYEQGLGDVDVLSDTHAGRLVAEAALRSRRSDVLAKLLRAPEGPRHVALLKSFSTQRRLTEAMEIFRACPEKTASLYNALLDACIDSQDIEAAEQIMAEAVAAGTADVVTYNTMIKKYLQRGEFKRARVVIETMHAAGGSLAPNCVTFNELIDATIKTSTDGVWLLIDEMKACGLQPNSITCSILLKSVQRGSSNSDIERIMAFVDTMEDVMDEVLLSSVCEACIRINRTDLLRKHLKRQRSGHGVHIIGAHTFGSMVRAYGFLKDLCGAWDVWGEMRSRNIIPTSITIGCMVEALVSNGDCDAGYELIHELRADEQTRPLLNAVIYCSVLKGFTHLKRFDRVQAVYEEMLGMQLQFSIVTYNALIDAFVRSGQMVRIAPLMEDMARQKIDANVVTYSTIVKGYCQENRLDKAFELVAAMRKSQNFRPDEVTYNTIIDGCAQRGLFEQGMRLLDEMQEEGVPPSNFTLSVLVKLANRSKRPDKAFEICERLSSRYHLQLNVHVYDNLVQACTANGDVPRAIRVLEQMLRDRVRPDTRTYALLLRSCVGEGRAKDILGLTRAAVGLPGAHPAVTGFGHLAPQPHGGLPADLLTEVLEGLASKCGEEREAIQLLKDLRNLPGVKLDPKLSLSLTSRVISMRNGP